MFAFSGDPEFLYNIPGRAIVEIGLYGAVYVCALAILGWLGYHCVPRAPLELVGTIALFVLLGLGLGLILAVASHRRPRVTTFINLVFFPLYFLSGVIFPLHSLSPDVRDMLLWNPVLHLVELARYNFIPNYTILPQVAATDDSFNYMFVGALPVLLLIWLGFAGGGLFRRGNRPLTAGLALALLYSIGRYSPLFPWIFDCAPIVDFFRRPIDGVFIVGIAVALLSGQLINDYVKRGLPRVHPLMTAIVVATCCFPEPFLTCAYAESSGWRATCASKASRSGAAHVARPATTASRTPRT